MRNNLGKDLFEYKLRFITAVLLFGYTLLHVKFTGEYVDATLDQWYSLTVRFPFGQRLLIPAVVRLLGEILPLNIGSLFFITEFGIVTLFYFSLKKLLAYEFPPRQSQYLSWLFILLLPLIMVINYRLTSGGKAPLYFPYDSASLLFMTVGYLLCLQKRWIYLISWIFLATFNRESSLLLILLIPAIHHQHLKQVIKPTLFSFLSYCLARAIIFKIYAPFDGDVFEFFINGETHFFNNLKWLLDDQNIFIFIFCFAGLPLFWFAFYDYIPSPYSFLRYIAFFYFCSLLLVGNFREARIFLELIILLYLPVCIAINRWGSGLEPYSSGNNLFGFLYYINRYCILASLGFIVLFRHSINQILLYLLA